MKALSLLTLRAKILKICSPGEFDNLFSGIDVDKLLRDAFNGTGKYSKAAKLATELCKRDEKLKQGLCRIFTKEELEQIAKESVLKTNEALKNKIGESPK